MKKVNELFSMETKGNKVVGKFHYGRKSEIIEIESRKPETVTFTFFCDFCIKYYEIYLCAYCDLDFMVKYARENNIPEDVAIQLFEDAEEIALKLESVYGEQLGHIVKYFTSKGLNICGNKFDSIEEKVEYLITTMRYRLKKLNLL